MKQYRVEITDRALKDMEEIYTYIADQLQVPENAIRQYERIADAKRTLDFARVLSKLLTGIGSVTEVRKIP